MPNSPIWVLAANSYWLAKNQPLAQKFMDYHPEGLAVRDQRPGAAVADYMRDYPKAESLEFAKQWKDTIALSARP